uniref:Uncharacterized protein n=1 Tax=Rhizophora mucronata TaxID=61149 RepID=A0A2P2KG57_RHIMU
MKHWAILAINMTIPQQKHDIQVCVCVEYQSSSPCTPFTVSGQAKAALGSLTCH